MQYYAVIKIMFLKFFFWRIFNDSEKYSLYNTCRKCRLQDFIENNATYINKKPKCIWNPGKKQDIFGGYFQDVRLLFHCFSKNVVGKYI